MYYQASGEFVAVFETWANYLQAETSPPNWFLALRR